MSRILTQANKEWIEFRRDRLALALAFLLPIFSLVLFGYGIRLESKNIPVAVQDLDRTPLSREYIRRIWATNVFIPASWTGTAKSPFDAIDQGIAKVAVLVPSGFASKIYAREPSSLEVLIDGCDLNDAQIVFNTIKLANAYFLQIMLKPVRHLVKEPEPVRADLRIWFNPGLSEKRFIVPGVFGVILWMYPALLSAVAASREKEQGTIVRVYASPLSAIELLLGKALVYFSVGMALALTVMVLGSLLFGVVVQGDPTPIFIGSALYVMTAVLFGLLLGTYATSQTTAVQATSSAGFFPCLLLSGFVYPINNIPFPMSLFSIIVPGRYFIELARETFVRGIGWTAVWQDPLILMLFVIAFLTISWLGMRRLQLRD